MLPLRCMRGRWNIPYRRQSPETPSGLTVFFNPSVEGTHHEIENPQRYDPHR